MRGGLAALLAATILSIGSVAAAPPAPQPPEQFLLGVSWYPEWVPEASWDADLALMRTAGITYVRIGEFAWERLEPVEGHYALDWLDRAIARARAHGMKVLLGTPTAAPPAWLTSRYPDVLLVEADGRRAEHGGRRHFSVTSPTYRLKARQIAAKLAERFGRNPALIGFQIDNEYGRESHDASTLQAFHQWLAKKYGTIDRLNSEWFTVYWSRAYEQWDQIGIPDPKYANPPMRLDWLRFLSDTWRDYQANQIAALRPHLSADKIVTTNFVAKYDEFDFSVPAQDLDVVGWDWYFEQPRLDPAEGAMLHDLYRGFLGRNPWIIEATPSNIIYADRNYAAPPGQVRAMMWQAIGHGADSYSFWPWMTPPGGNEPLHGSLVDLARRPRPPFAEIAQAGKEIARLWPALRGSVPVADVAMLHDYPNRWAIKREPLTVDYDPWTLYVDFHRAVAPHVEGIDVLRRPDNLARYRLVVAPNLPMVDDAEIAALTDYVRKGGHLLIGPRAGGRDTQLRVRPVGAFEKLLGARIDHYEVPAEPVDLSGRLGSAKASIWAERIVPEAPLDTLLTYRHPGGWLDGAPAVVSRKVGKGRVTYVAAWLDAPALDRVAQWAAAQAGARPLLGERPAGVEAMARAKDDRRLIVLVNWSDKSVDVPLPAPMRRLLDGQLARSVTLDRFGVEIVEAAR